MSYIIAARCVTHTIARTCRWWNYLVNTSDVLWYEVAKNITPQFSGVISGAKSRSLTWRSYVMQCQQLSCDKSRYQRLFLDGPRKAGMKDCVQPINAAYPDGNKRQGILSTISSFLGLGDQSRARTTRETEIAPDTSRVHCVSLIGSVKNLLYSLWDMIESDCPFVRSGVYPGGAMAVRMGEKEEIFISRRLAPTSRYTQGVIIVTNSNVDANEISTIAEYLKVCRDHNKALPVAILIPKKKDNQIRPSELALSLKPLLEEIDNVCVEEFHPDGNGIAFVGVAQALEWLSRHFITISDPNM